MNGKYTVGVLVQLNYGHVHDLQIGGVPVGKLLLKDSPNYQKAQPDAFSGKADDGSIVIILM